jgi:hypothetical protein
LPTRTAYNRRVRGAFAAAAIGLMTAVVSGSLVIKAAQAPAGSRPPLVDRFLTADESSIVSYKAIRRLTASTRGGRMSATIEASTTLDPKDGFQYQILSEEGSPLIRRKVLIAALEAERQAVLSADARGSRLTPENYDFLGVSVASERLYRIEVRARRKHQMLIDGSLYVDGDSADLVRVEGELSKRPSFWTRRVRIVREYARIDGMHVPVAMRSTADVLIVGASSFAMTYRYTEINGHAVDGEKPLVDQITISEPES